MTNLSWKIFTEQIISMQNQNFDSKGLQRKHYITTCPNLNRLSFNFSPQITAIQLKEDRKSEPNGQND